MGLEYGQLPAAAAQSGSAQLSAHEQKELDELIRGNYELLSQQGGGEHVLPNNNHGGATQVRACAVCACLRGWRDRRRASRCAGLLSDYMLTSLTYISVRVHCCESAHVASDVQSPRPDAQ